MLRVLRSVSANALGAALFDYGVEFEDLAFDGARVVGILDG
jgi:hypothetical protein